MSENLRSQTVVPPVRLAVDTLVPHANKAMGSLDAAAPFFTARERAALALTEAVTRLSQGPVSDAVCTEAAEHFSETELAELIWAIAVINAWNRLGATARPWPLA
jgi:alkylhydroperoxidase family enzyme